jgi:predicted RecA/RadA family phage recombinase
MPTTTTTRPEPGTNGSRPRRPQLDGRGTTAGVTARNRTRMLVGALIALGSAFAAAVLYADAGERRPVLALAEPVAAGQVIEDDDLREVMVAVDGQLAVVDADDRASVVGRTAAVPLAAGALLTPDQLGDERLLDPADAVFGALLAEGTYPAELRAGDRVLLYELPGAAGDDTEVPGAVTGTVVALQAAETPGAVDATIGVAAGDAGEMAVAAGQDRLIVVLAPR